MSEQPPIVIERPLVSFAGASWLILIGSVAVLAGTVLMFFFIKLCNKEGASFTRMVSWVLLGEPAYAIRKSSYARRVST